MLTPFPYQQDAIDVGINKNVLIADACGTGKTLTGIEIAIGVQETWNRPTLVVCTKSARLQWLYAIEDQAPSNAHIKVLDATLDFEYAIEDLDTRDWFILHYAAFRKVKRSDMIARTFFATIILDEAHRIKGRNTQQTKGIKRLLSRRKIPMTATEMESSPADLWSLLNWMYPEKFRGYHGFHARYVKTEENWMGYKKDVGIRPEAKDRLGKLLAPLVFKRSKEDVRPDLPPLREQRLPLEMNSSLQGVYTKIQTAGDILVDIGDTTLVVPNVLSRVMKERQVLSNGMNLTKSDKLKWVIEYFKDNPDTNIAVFTAFVDTAGQIAHALDIPLHVGGSHYDIAGKKPKRIVGTIKALGESHDMPWIDVAVFIDTEWSSIAMTQAINRIHRINITSPKLVIYLYHPGTVDELIFDALDNKWTNIQIVEEYIRRYS